MRASIRITVKQRESPSNLKVMLVTSETTLAGLARNAGVALGLNDGKKGGKGVVVPRLLFANGSDIDDIRLLRDNDVVFASTRRGDRRRSSDSKRPRGSSRLEKYQVCVMGPGGVGKSALSIRFCQNEFIQDYDPTIEDAYLHTCTVDNRAVVLDVVDTAGQDEYSALRDNWMQESEAFLLVYDVTKPETLREVQEKFASRLKQVREGTLPVTLLVGNKTDLITGRHRRNAAAAQWATTAGLVGHQETSAKTGKGVKEAFATVVRALRLRARTTQDGSAQRPPVKRRTKGIFALCSIV